jgi:hypothetical protein
MGENPIQPQKAAKPSADKKLPKEPIQKSTKKVEHQPAKGATVNLKQVKPSKIVTLDSGKESSSESEEPVK